MPKHIRMKQILQQQREKKRRKNPPPAQDDLHSANRLVTRLQVPTDNDAHSQAPSTSHKEHYNFVRDLQAR